MKCFYDPDIDAVGTCTQCNKAACSQCLLDVGQMMVCRGCISTEFKRKNRIAKVYHYTAIFFAILGLLFGFIFANTKANPYVAESQIKCFSFIFSFIQAYCYWAMVWGSADIFGLLKNFRLPSIAGLGCIIFVSLPIFLVIFMFALSLVLTFLMFYGPLGGGLKNYLRYRKRGYI